MCLQFLLEYSEVHQLAHQQQFRQLSVELHYFNEKWNIFYGGIYSNGTDMSVWIHTQVLLPFSSALRLLSRPVRRGRQKVVASLHFRLEQLFARRRDGAMASN